MNLSSDGRSIPCWHCPYGPLPVRVRTVEEFKAHLVAAHGFDPRQWERKASSRRALRPVSREFNGVGLA